MRRRHNLAWVSVRRSTGYGAFRETGSVLAEARLVDGEIGIKWQHHRRDHAVRDIVHMPGHGSPPIPRHSGAEKSERTRNPETSTEFVSGFRVRRYVSSRNDGKKIHPPLPPPLGLPHV